MNMIDNEDIDQLIATYLAEGLPAGRVNELKQWVESSPENRNYFENRQKVWLAASVTNSLENFDREKAYKRFAIRTGKAVGKRQAVKRKLSVKWGYGIAVTVALLLVSYFSYRQGGEQVKSRFNDIVVEAPLGSRIRMSLPDGTSVWLNAGSKMIYSQGFGVNDRNVELLGEAYFEVVRNENLKFNVGTQELQVTVLGTKFDFKNYPEDEKAVVSLVEGRVLATNHLRRGNKADLYPDQQVSLNKRTGEMRVLRADAKRTTGWTDGYLSFDEELLPDIIKELERSYDVKFTLKDESLKTFRFYGSFAKKEYRIEELLDVLASTNKIAYTIKGKEIELTAR